VQGLITFDLDFPKPDFSCCVPVPEVLSIVTSGVSQSVSENTCNSLDKSADGTRSLSGEFGRIKPCLKMRRSKTVPSTVTTSVPAVVKSSPATSSSSSVDISPDGDDQDKLQEVKKAIQAYECGSKKRFFAMKKSKLNLSGLQLREKHLPLQDLVGTPLGLSVQHLSLSHNLFETLPPSLVVSLPNLKSLDLSNCCISNLPINWNVPKLKKLNLSNNRLSSFPGEEMLRGMPELEELNLSCNQLKKAKIPQGLLLCKLKNLDLSTNLISSLPKDLVRLSALRVFDIQNNPVKEVPVDIVSSMNGFLLEAVSDQPMKGKKAAWSGSQRAKKSMWNSKGLSMGDDSSMEGKRFSAPRMKQVSITRSTQNTVPVEDISERCENSVDYL
jgi:Leucine-rich repeat (LRR) protein